jgi:superfamily II DNA or RNA helicase
MISIDFYNNKKNLMQIICNSDELELIRHHFSCPNPAAIARNKFTPKRLYAITPAGKFESGLLEEIKKYLISENLNFEISENIKRSKIVFETCEIDPMHIPYREYQENAIEKAIKENNGVIVVGTGGGKTLLTAGLIVNLRKTLKKPNAKVLVTVPTIQLVEQTASDFKEYGLSKISKWSGKNKLDTDADIIVAGTQYLVGKNTDLSILNDIDILIMDECHVLKKNNEINNIFKFIDTPFKFGLTGSLPEEKIDQWNINGKLGPIIFEKKTDELKKGEYVSDFQIYLLEIDHGKTNFPFNPNSPTSKYENELTYLMTCEKRNDIISKLVNKINKNTIIMVDRILHGEELLNSLKKICVDSPVYFIQGSTEIEDREKIKNLMENQSNVIVVAISKIFSTGINIPNLHSIVFASAGKAKIKIVQSIGRALRLHPTKEKAYIFDIADNTYYGKIHKEERKKLYNVEKYPFVEKKI